MKIIRHDETITTCGCCGKADISGTFAVQLNDEFVINYSHSCLTRLSGKSLSEVRKEAREAAADRKLDELKNDLRIVNAWDRAWEGLSINPEDLPLIAEWERSACPIDREAYYCAELNSQMHQ